jgi:hypothetical protein
MIAQECLVDKMEVTNQLARMQQCGKRPSWVMTCMWRWGSATGRWCSGGDKDAASIIESQTRGVFSGRSPPPQLYPHFTNAGMPVRAGLSCLFWVLLTLGSYGDGTLESGRVSRKGAKAQRKERCVTHHGMAALRLCVRPPLTQDRRLACAFSGQEFWPQPTYGKFVVGSLARNK